MGLDMYLYRKNYVQNWDFMQKNEKHQISVKKGGVKRNDIKPERITYIVEQIGYWRKFNALHKWFVDNCQNGVDDCKEYYVSKEKLQELLLSLKKIKTEHGLSGELLPTESGFFFGSTEYDEYYYDSVKYTAELIESILSENNDDGIYYQSSW